MAKHLGNVSDYLQSLTGVDRTNLYRQPATALAIFRRMLSHLGKTLVTAMLYSRDPMQHEFLSLWVRPDSRREMEEAAGQLERLNILESVKTQQSKQYKLKEPFASSLRAALTGSGDHNSFGVPISDVHDEGVNMDNLDDYAREQWETLLYYIVGSAGQSSGRDFAIGEGSKVLLEAAGLVERAGGRPAITQLGFTFLLQEVTTQLWALLITYIEKAESLSMKPIEVLSFLFMLGSLEVGQAYSTSTLTSTQRQMLEDLGDLGLVYLPDDNRNRFYPTRLAHTLNSDSNAFASSLSAELGASSEKGYVIVETNYRIYAYTDSALRISILALFARLGTKHPNMITGRLTKDSIQGAIALGITSQQIIDYLQTHAHPIMASDRRSGQPQAEGQKRPILPPTVVDQIRLWQIEGDRMQTTAGYLFKDFEDPDDYEASWKHADIIGVLVWRSDTKKCFFVTDHKQLAPFVRARLAARGQNNGLSRSSTPGTPR